MSELGEFALIDRLAQTVTGKPRPDLVVGIGDDTAVWRSGSEFLLATTDTLVEGVHFRASQKRWSDVGWKSVAVNVSDIAAMGGQPLFALVTLALPEATQVDTVDEIYDGINECATAYGIAIAGGDIVRAPSLSVTVALTGRAQTRDGAVILMRRDAAKVGDVIAVTGTLGDSAAGLRLLEEDPRSDQELVRAHLRPQPPLMVAQEACRLGVRSAIDVSDGLLADTAHICKMSGVAADVRAADIPISESLGSTYPSEALDFACGGGEDYQIVLVASSGVIAALTELRPNEVTVIGRITDGPPAQVRLLDVAGAELEAPTGWDHLRPQTRRKR